MPLTVEELPFDVTRKRYLANVIVQSLLLGLGLFFIVLGVWLTRMAIGVDMVTGLEVILVFSSSFMVGFQLLSIAISMSLFSELRLAHLNHVLRDFTFATAALLWIFGIWTYLLSWPIETQIMRELLVISSTFVSLWAMSLLVNQSTRVRILTDIMLLGGLAISLNVWFSLSNLTLTIFGGIILCSVLVHLLLTSIHLLDERLITPPTYKPDSKHPEKEVEQTS